MSSVINIRTKYIRPEYDNLKEWMEENDHVYIGRKGVVFINGKRFPEMDSIWANPFKIGSDRSRDDVIDLYRKYLKKRLRTDPVLGEQLLDLDGKILGCWCKPDACHGDVILELLEEMKK